MFEKKGSSFIAALLISALVLFVSTGSIQAADKTWNAGNDAAWETAANWTPSGEPTALQTVEVDNGNRPLITQAGEVCSTLHVGMTTYSDIKIDSGSLTSNAQYIGWNAKGYCYHNGGTNTVNGTLGVGYNGTGSAGSRYLLYGGTLNVTGATYVAYWGTDTRFLQSNSTANLNTLYIGFKNLGRYYLNTGADLNVTGETNFGYNASATFHQDAGTATFGGAVYVGRTTGGTGRYYVKGGAAEFESHLYIGYGAGSNGYLEFQDGDDSTPGLQTGSILVKGAFVLAAADLSHVTALAGSKIKLAGVGFINHGNNEANVAGLSNIEFIFEAGAATDATVEVAGTVDGGFTNNFAMGGLTLGGADVGKVQLVDDSNNGNRGTGSEAMFANAMTIGAGSSLDVNGLRLYILGDVATTLDGYIAAGTLFDSTLAGPGLDAIYDSGNNWTTLVIPEPGTMLLLTAGGIVVLARKKR